LQSEISELTRQLELLSSDHATALSESASMRATLEKQLSKRIEELTELNESGSAQAIEMEEVVDGLEQELESMRRRLDLSERAQLSLEEERRVALQGISLANDKLLTLESESALLSEEIDRLKAEVIYLQSHRDSILDDHATTKEALEGHAPDIARLEQHCALIEEAHSSTNE
jgi:chromosome segregation ATPase